MSSDSPSPFPLYKYITNKDFSIEFNSEEEEVTVKLCIYNVNTECYVETTTVKDVDKHLHEEHIKKSDFKLETLLKDNDTPEKKSFICPFVEFAFIHKNNQYEFPSFQFKPINVTNKTVPKEEDDEYDLNIDSGIIDYPYGNTTYFENECFLQLFKLFTSNPHQMHLSKINDMYKGFIQTDNTHYTVFFDITSFVNKNPNLVQSKCIFGILDEIIYKKKIWDTPIDRSVISLFKKHKHLRSIRNEDDVDYPIPLQTYMCEKKNDQYISKTKSLFPSYIEPFGLCYYMTNEKFSEKPDRFAIFVVNCLYNIELKEDDDIFIRNKKGDLKELVDEKLTNALLSNATFHFTDINIQIWGIRDNLHLTKLK
jgi:hypothetical protein